MKITIEEMLVEPGYYFQTAARTGKRDPEKS